MWLINLIINEIIKNFNKRKTFIFSIIIILSVMSLGIYYKKQSNVKDWKAETKKEINKLYSENNEYMKDIDKENKNKEISKMIIDINNQKIAIYNYALQNNIPYNIMTSWKFVDKAMFFSTFIFIFIIISASESIASEFNQGTIRYLVIRPIKRWKLIAGKLISLIIFSVVLLLFLLIISTILGFSLFGFDGINGKELFYENGKIIEFNIIKLILLKYLFEIIRFSIIISLALMLSTLFRSSSISLAVSMAIIIGGNIAVNTLSRFKWIKYVLLYNLNLKQYLPGNTHIIQGTTLQFSLFILLIYFILFNFISFLYFSKQDIY